MNKIKNFFKALVLTKLGRFLGSFLFSLLFYIIAYKTDDYGKDTLTMTLLYISGILGIVFLVQLVMWFTYAWVINPIRDYCSYKGKNKKFCKLIKKKKK
jgi:hypothetical protein